VIQKHQMNTEFAVVIHVMKLVIGFIGWLTMLEVLRCCVTVTLKDFMQMPQSVGHLILVVIGITILIHVMVQWAITTAGSVRMILTMLMDLLFVLIYPMKIFVWQHPLLVNGTILIILVSTLMKVLFQYHNQNGLLVWHGIMQRRHRTIRQIKTKVRTNRKNTMKM